MTEAAPWFSLPNPPSLGSQAQSVLVIGAGLAGCWLARTLAERGIQCTILDANEVASGASGNTVGVVKPYVTRKPGFTDYFYNKAFACLIQRLADWRLSERCGYTRCGVLQLSQTPYPELDAYRFVSPEEADELAGININRHGLWFEDSGYLAPQALCHALLEHPLIKLVANSKVSRIESTHESVTVELANNHSLQADIVVIAAGNSLTEFAQSKHLAVIPARGQTSDFQCDKGDDFPQCVISGKHYVIPGQDSVTVGATFQRDDSSTKLRELDHASNFAGLHELLPNLRVDPVPVNGRAAVRATTPDRLPLVGPVPDYAATADTYRDLHHGRPTHQYPDLPTIPRLMVLGGFGSRGIVTSAYAAQLLADYVLDRSSSSTDDTLESFAALLNPVRFQIRDLRRGQ